MNMPSSMKELEHDILVYLQKRKWDTLRPGDLAKSVSIEAAELLELFQWDNPSLEELRNDPKRIASLRKEVADILIYCIDIAVLVGFDTEEAIREKLAHVEKKYPAELFNTRDTSKDAGTEDLYWNIKRSHRATES